MKRGDSKASAARALALRERADRSKPYVRVSADTAARLEAFCAANGIDYPGRVVDEIIARSVPPVAESRAALKHRAITAEDLLDAEAHHGS